MDMRWLVIRRRDHLLIEAECDAGLAWMDDQGNFPN